MKPNLMAEVAWVEMSGQGRPPTPEEAVLRGHQSDEKDPGAQRTSPLRSKGAEQRCRDRPAS